MRESLKTFLHLIGTLVILLGFAVLVSAILFWAIFKYKGIGLIGCVTLFTLFLLMYVARRASKD